MKLTADGRPSARKHGYTVRWEKAARRFLAKHPTCARFGIDPKCKVWPQRWITSGPTMGISGCSGLAAIGRGCVSRVIAERHWQSGEQSRSRSAWISTACRWTRSTTGTRSRIDPHRCARTGEEHVGWVRYRELYGASTGLHKLKPERGAVWGRVYPLSGSISWRAAVLLPAAHLPFKPPAVARRQRRRRQAQSRMQFAKPFHLLPHETTLKLWRISSTASISGGRQHVGHAQRLVELRLNLAHGGSGRGRRDGPRQTCR